MKLRVGECEGDVYEFESSVTRVYSRIAIPLQIVK